MEKIEQKNSQEVQQENYLEGKNATPVEISVQSEEEPIEPEVVQLVPPQEALDRAAELERLYRETVERENK